MIQTSHKSFDLAPIALFVYNRPDHTRQTIEALLANYLSSQSDLFIFSDALKDEVSAGKVQEVRKYIQQVQGFKSITIIEQTENFGLAKSIIEGVTRLVEQHGRVIVLEDDLITSPYFLRFMNDALEKYKNQEKVMHISGYMFPIDGDGLGDTFFLRTASCWGWATWGRAWSHFDKNPGELIKNFSKKDIDRFNIDGAYNFWGQVEQNWQGKLNTWAIFWYASIFLAEGLCLHPKKSMVNNIGHDASGVHCAENSEFSTNVADEPVNAFDSNIEENLLALARTKRFLEAVQPALWLRIGRRLGLRR